MNDLFRRNAPRLSDEEDRRTWERVRQAAARPVPWWAALWARPAVRFGLPAVAVVLVAIVWVAVEQPASTRVPQPGRAALERVERAGGQGAPRVARNAPGPGARELGPVTPAAPPAPRAKATLEAREQGARPPEILLDKEQAAAGAPAGEPGRDAPHRLLAESAPAPTAAAPPPPTGQRKAAAAPVPSASGLALAPPPAGGANFGALKQPFATEQSVRGGRADRLAPTADRATAGPTLAAVAALLARRPLAFTAPLPPAAAAGRVPGENAHIEISPGGGVTVNLVLPGAEAEAPAGPTYDRYEDAGPAEQVLLVAYAADRVAGSDDAAVGGRLLAEARRLESQGGPQHAAALELLTRLARAWGTGSTAR